MKDIQNLRDYRKINIRKVGVKTISYPVTVLDRQKKNQKTVATVNMYVNLPHRFKGTHMSRFVEILHQFHGDFNPGAFHRILQEMKERLDSEAAHLEIEFPYFVQCSTSEKDTGLECYHCRMHGSLADEDDFVLEITVPVTLPLTAPPVGGMPSSQGLWGKVRAAVRFHRFVWLEEVIRLIEMGLRGSGGFQSVESVAAAVGERLAGHDAISWFQVRVENFAQGYSIFASVSEDRRETEGSRHGKREETDEQRTRI